MNFFYKYRMCNSMKIQNIYIFQIKVKSMFQYNSYHLKLLHLSKSRCLEMQWLNFKLNKSREYLQSLLYSTNICFLHLQNVYLCLSHKVIKVYKKVKIGMKMRRKYFDKQEIFEALLLSRDDESSCCFSSPEIF